MGRGSGRFPNVIELINGLADGEIGSATSAGGGWREVVEAVLGILAAGEISVFVNEKVVRLMNPKTTGAKKDGRPRTGAIQKNRFSETFP